MEPSSGWLLFTLGLLLLAGYGAHVLGRRAHVPRVTLLLLLGVVAGPSALGLVPEAIVQWFPAAAQIALSIVGFMLGERFLGGELHRTGRVVLRVTLAESLGATLAVLAGLLLARVPPVLALLLAGIAPASDPAATFDVTRENRSSGPLTETVLGVVAIDDAFGILIFSLLLVVAESVTGAGAGWAALAAGGWEILGAVLLGTGLGLPMAWLTGRIRPGELTLIETLGFVLLCGGLAGVLGTSYLLASIVLGAVVANRAKHHHRPFHAIEGVSQPFLIVFFLLAGFEFDLPQLRSFGAAGAAYVVSRSLGKIAGGYLGARWAGAPAAVRRYVGWCLLPQAGVAIGLGLLAAQRLPELGGGLIALVVGTTVFFEVLGPIATRIALRRAREAHSG